MKMMSNFVLVLLFVLFSVSSPSHQACVRSTIDAVSILSQGKSFFQVLFGDAKCAKETQENFVRTAPVYSQLTSIVQSAMGDDEEAKKTQKMFVANLEDRVDQTPIIGHLKGAIHLATGDKERGDQIMKDASRGLAVEAGSLVSGPAGALAGGVLYDSALSIHDVAVNKDDAKGYGVIKNFKDAIEGNLKTGEIFDSLVGLVDYSGFNPLAKSNRKRRSTTQVNRDESDGNSSFSNCVMKCMTNAGKHSPEEPFYNVGLVNDSELIPIDKRNPKKRNTTEK